MDCIQLFVFDFEDLAKCPRSYFIPDLVYITKIEVMFADHVLTIEF